GAVAARVAAAGAGAEAVGVVPPDPAGDALLFQLSAAGIRHAAVLRSPATSLEPADLDLALRYLPDVRAIVVVDATAELAATAAAAAGWSDAALVLVTPAADAPAELPAEVADRTLVLAAPPSDPDGAFAGFVAGLAVRLAEGATAADAWTQTAAALGVESISPGSSPSRPSRASTPARP
ncbi:MAG TPA: hypothetical protein VF484_10950, partial [Candidatus Limnocylindrales bacterium]